MSPTNNVYYINDSSINRNINKTKINANPVAMVNVVSPILLIVLSIKKLLSKPSHSKIDRDP